MCQANNKMDAYLLKVTYEGLPVGGRGRGGCMFSCSLEKIGVSPLFPPKYYVPLSSLLLSSTVPRNSTACCLDPQKYSLMFPKIPNIFQFLMLSYFHKFYLAIHSRENHPFSKYTCFVSLMNIVTLPHIH